METIANQKAVDPLVGVKIGAKELTQLYFSGLKDERGVHVETALAAAGAVAGFACQWAVRLELEKRNLRPDAALVEVGCEDGSKHYTGGAVNELLLQSQHSVWGLAAGMAQHLGAKTLLDPADAVGYVARTFCSSEFGLPRLPDGVAIKAPPIELLCGFWTHAQPKLTERCDQPREWPIMCGLAVQEIMQQGRGAISAETALVLVMESAIPMSRIDPALVKDKALGGS